MFPTRGHERHRFRVCKTEEEEEEEKIEAPAQNPRSRCVGNGTASEAKAGALVLQAKGKAGLWPGL